MPRPLCTGTTLLIDRRGCRRPALTDVRFHTLPPASASCAAIFSSSLHRYSEQAERTEAPYPMPKRQLVGWSACPADTTNASTATLLHHEQSLRMKEATHQRSHPHMRVVRHCAQLPIHPGSCLIRMLPISVAQGVSLAQSASRAIRHASASAPAPSASLGTPTRRQRSPEAPRHPHQRPLDTIFQVEKACALKVPCARKKLQFQVEIELEKAEIRTSIS